MPEPEVGESSGKESKRQPTAASLPESRTEEALQGMVPGRQEVYRGGYSLYWKGSRVLHGRWAEHSGDEN